MPVRHTVQPSFAYWLPNPQVIFRRSPKTPDFDPQMALKTENCRNSVANCDRSRFTLAQQARKSAAINGEPILADTSENGAFVEFERVQKSYDGENLVVKDLNLSMPKGEFLTMLGPSGSGKTTCLMMLAGFETATHGDIRLDGNSINNIPPHKRGIGMVFQNYALFPHMTVAENLSFPLEVRKIDKSEREKKVKRALDMVQMGAFGGRRPA